MLIANYTTKPQLLPPPKATETTKVINNIYFHFRIVLSLQQHTRLLTFSFPADLGNRLAEVDVNAALIN